MINCQNQTAIGGGTECPQYGRFPCEGVVVNQGAKGQINATQVREYDEDSETMALSVALKRLQGECATCGKFVLHFMHTSPPAVLNCSLERQVRTLSSRYVATRSAHLRLCSRTEILGKVVPRSLSSARRRRTALQRTVAGGSAGRAHGTS